MITEKIKLPHIIDMGGISKNDFIQHYLTNRTKIEEELNQYGAIKFAGVAMESQQDFQEIMNSISEKFLAYIDGNSPRTKLSSNMYTSTEYDQNQKITMHNELSYSHKWPNKLFFSCMDVADTGGETLLADSRSILQAMDSAIVEEVEKKGVIYIRNLHAGLGMGPSWQDTFETTEKSEVEAHCERLHIDFTWKTDDAIQLKHKRAGIIKHRNTGEKVWFNQIDQFHPYHLGQEYYDMIKMLFENPSDYPMYVTYGDGSPISEGVVKSIIETIDSVTIAPQWNRNEILLVDNELVSHGRNPYAGSRRVLVSMSV